MAERTAAERVALARHPQRPNITDYINGLFTDFFEQRGDRACREDAAILGGIALFHERPVTVIGTRKGKDLEENLNCNFGMPDRPVFCPHPPAAPRRDGWQRSWCDASASRRSVRP